MAFPITDIDITLLANYLGIPFQDVGQQFVDNPNKHGFNCGAYHPELQAHYWGLSPAIPGTLGFDLSAFKNFDRYWRCYTLENCEIGGDLGIYGPGFLGFYLKPILPLTEAPAFETVPHTFDLLMNRYAPDWNPVNGSVTLLTDWTMYEDAGKKIDIDPLSPPDGLGPLQQNSTIYFSLRHKTSPERRWDSRWFTPVTPIGGAGTITKDNDQNYDGWIISIEIGQV